MLKNRVITALSLAPLVISAVYFLDHTVFVSLIAVVIALAASEWAGFCGAQTLLGRGIYALALLSCLAGLYFIPQYHLAVITLGDGVWVLAIAAVLLFPRAQALYKSPLLLAPLGWLILAVAWLCVLQIHRLEQGSHWVVWALFLVWAADVGAYFAGKAFGTRKLAPAVSPGKTWEGALGGLLLAMSVCGSVAVWWHSELLPWLPLTLVLVIVSVFGDLFESLLKRSTGIKDSGTILPGHGGLLDRIDSLLAVLPVLTVFLLASEG